MCASVKCVHRIIGKILSFIRKTNIYSVSAVLLCYITLKPLRTDAGMGVCLLLCLLTYISAVKLDRNFEFIKSILTGCLSTVAFIILYFYFCFSIYGTVFLEENGLDGFSYGKPIYIIMSFIWTWPLFLQSMVWLYDFVFSAKREEFNMPIKMQMAAICLMMLYNGLWLYAFNPCIGSIDSYMTYYWAHKIGKEVYFNWHPAFYVLVLSMLLKICDSAVFLILIQCVAYSVLVVRIITYLMKKGISKSIALVIYLILGFSFNNSIQLISLFKDTPYTISILWLTYLLIRYVDEVNGVPWLWYFEIGIAMIFTALFRQNGIMPVGIAVLALIIIAFTRKNLRLALTMIITIVCIGLIIGPVFSHYKVKNIPGMKYFALTNDLIGSYYACEHPTDEVVVMMNEITGNNPKDLYHTSYYTWYYDANTPLNDYSVSKFMHMYIKTFIEHPKAMILEVLRRNTVVWSIIMPEEEEGDCINYLKNSHPEETIPTI